MIGISDKVKRWTVGLVGVVMILWSGGWIDPVESIPVWWRLVATGVVLAAGAGWIAAGKVYDLLPEDDGIFLVVLDDTELGGGEVHELNEDEWANLEVYGGRLHPWDNSPKRVYECVDYIESHGVAIAGWPETPPASATRAHHDVPDVMEYIRELRNDLEPAAAEARFLKRRMRGIVRRLDSEREDAQQKMLDDTVTPAVGDSATISEVIQDEIPEDLHPAMMSESKAEQVADGKAATEDPDSISFDVLDDGDALEPVATDGGDNQ